MARKNPERQRLLGEVVARQRAAGKKVSRLKSQGVDAKQQGIDPRKPLPLVRRYTAKQLQAHLDRLNTFTSRKTQFMADTHGRLLPPEDVARYKTAERKINAARKKAVDLIGDIKAPGAGGLTIAERQKAIGSDRPSARTPVNPFAFEKRTPNSFTSAEALRKITADLEKKLQGDFLGKNLASDRQAAYDMLDILRDTKMKTKIEKMDDFHFNILWNFTKFPRHVSSPYNIAKQLLESKREPWHEKVFEENLASAGSLVDAVQKIKLRR